MLTHKNIISVISGIYYSHLNEDLKKYKKFVSILPLAHSF